MINAVSDARFLSGQPTESRFTVATALRKTEILNQKLDLEKKGLQQLVLMANLEKIMQEKGGFRDYVVRQSNIAYESDYLFLGFYTQSKESNVLLYNMAIFDFMDDKLVFWAINSTPLVMVTQEGLEKKLKKLGFSDISVFGASHSSSLFEHHFNPLQSDWMVVVAKR